MELRLSTEQAALLDTTFGLMRRFPAVERAEVLAGHVDHELLERLGSGGYLDVWDEGPLEAAFVVEATSSAFAHAPVAARVICGPMLGLTDLPDVVGLASSRSRSLVRYAADCEVFLVLDGDEAIVATADQAEIAPVEVAGSAAYGEVSVTGGESLGPGSGAVLRRAWQLAIAVEAGRTMLSAIEMTAAHTRAREQFGRPIGSFQAVQHRLARAQAMAVGTMWAARRAAVLNTDEYVTASAAAFACEAAQLTYVNTHQVTGAVGITDEYGLTLPSLRLLAIRQEIGGVDSHASRVLAARQLARSAS